MGSGGDAHVSAADLSDRLSGAHNRPHRDKRGQRMAVVDVASVEGAAGDAQHGRIGPGVSDLSSATIFSSRLTSASEIGWAFGSPTGSVAGTESDASPAVGSIACGWDLRPSAATGEAPLLPVVAPWPALDPHPARTRTRTNIIAAITAAWPARSMPAVQQVSGRGTQLLQRRALDWLVPRAGHAIETRGHEAGRQRSAEPALALEA